MANLSDTRDFMIECPEAFGMKLVWPSPRMDGIHTEVDVYKVELGDTFQTLHYRRNGIPLDRMLIRTDILWHLASNITALVVDHLTSSSVRIWPLCGCDTEEEMQKLHRSEGKGSWIPVLQGWREEWPLPPELIRGVPEIAEMEAAIDYMPNTRAKNRTGWVQQGLIDPNKPLSKEARRYMKRARKAMKRLADSIMPEEQDTQIPTTVEEVREKAGKGGVVQTTIPFDGRPEVEGKIVSYQGQKSKTRPGGK